MHLIFQFPIADLRPLITEDLRLIRPYWPSPDIADGKPFIRKFGQLKDRQLGGVTGWPSEEYFCDARLCVKYTDIHKNGYDTHKGVKAVIKKVYRRLYSDGRFMNKIELGFVDDLENRLSQYPLGKCVDLRDVVDHYCKLPVQIKDKTIPLSEAGSLLCGSFTESTTIRSKYLSDVKKLVIGGQLNITIVLSATDFINLPEHSQLINQYMVNRRKVFLYGTKLSVGNQDVKVWIIKAHKDTDQLPKGNPLKAVVRNLRINLARIHAERETLRILLSNIMIKSVPLEAGTAKSKMVTSYVKDLAEKLFAQKRNSLSQNDILDFALASENLALPGTLDTLYRTVIDYKDKYTLKVIKKLAYDLQAKKVTTVLYLTSNPKGKQLISVENEINEIDDKIERGKRRELYNFEPQLSVEKDELIRFMLTHQPRILHISLHNTKADGLFFKDSSGETSPISVAEFEEIIRTYTRFYKLDAVILTACNTHAHAKAILPYVKHAICTNTAIPTESGPVYAKHFYQTLFDSEEINIPLCHTIALLQLKQSGLKSSTECPIHEMFELLPKS